MIPKQSFKVTVIKLYPQKCFVTRWFMKLATLTVKYPYKSRKTAAFVEGLRLSQICSLITLA